MTDSIRFVVALAIIYLIALMLPTRWAYWLLGLLILGFLAAHIQTANSLSKDLDALLGAAELRDNA